MVPIEELEQENQPSYLEESQMKEENEDFNFPTHYKLEEDSKFYFELENTGSDGQKGIRNNQVEVLGINSEEEKQAVVKHFKQFGRINENNLVLTRNFVVLHYFKASDAEKAVKNYNERLFPNKKIVASFSRERNSKQTRRTEETERSHTYKAIKIEQKPFFKQFLESLFNLSTPL